MQKTKYFSYRDGPLPKGCQQCVHGRKMVLFITGLCPRKCYYCPVSDEKFGSDVIFANETPVKSVAGAIAEARVCGSHGAGITGGDPLSKVDRCVEYITGLKRAFGDEFHIHLYTSLNLATVENLKKLYTAGLDEIRFHLDLDSTKLWKDITRALSYSWDVGVEIPAEPKKKKQIFKMIDFLGAINKEYHGKVRFINLNELEVADNTLNVLSKLGYTTKDSISYGVTGSVDAASEFISYGKGKIPRIHFCTAKLKDKVQLGKRIKLRAEKVAQPFDVITKDGTLLRGAVYLSNLKPGTGYNEKIKSLPSDVRSMLVEELTALKEELQEDFEIPDDMIVVDTDRCRILTAADIIDAVRDEIQEEVIADIEGDAISVEKSLYLAKVIEYPTYDATLIDIEFL